MTKRNVGIGLVGAGFMGRCHANAFRAVGGLFDLPVEPVNEILADISDDTARVSAARLGFARSTGDWRTLVGDPAVDIVAVTAPNALHEPIVMAAIENGNAIYCEKPLSTTSASARRMTDAAEAAGVLTVVGFNFLRNPMVRLAREIVTGGELGEIIGFRGRHAENYMANPAAPHSFRTDVAGGGALADIGSHILSMARHILGPIVEVSGDLRTIYAERPVRAGASKTAPVLVDDMAHVLLRFKSGATGSIEANWAATARTMDLSFEVTGTKGALAYSQERMNELLLFRDTAGRSGYTRIEAGPAHTPYGNFCPAPGHHLGFNDLKVIEVAELLDAFANGANGYPDFREALAVQETVDAIRASSDDRQWKPVMLI